MSEMNLVIFISGRGSNLQAILDSAVGRRVSAVFSDNAAADGLRIARQHGKRGHTFERRQYATAADWEADILATLEPYSPCLVALAGFMSVLSANFIEQRQGRIVNIHPSLLPHFRGLATHRQALAAGAEEHGCTVHWVEEEVDAGAVIAQRRVPVLPDDDEETLAARVLSAEHRLYPKILEQLVK